MFVISINTRVLHCMFEITRVLCLQKHSFSDVTCVLTDLTSDSEEEEHEEEEG